MSGKVVSNLESLAEGIGSYIGMMEGLSQRDYMDELITDAHKKTSTEFNRAVMSAAMGSKKFNHVYEYGTVGINDEGIAHYSSGMVPGSRLWINTLTGGGGRKTISFVFRPAKQRVPPHNFKELGIDESSAPPLKVDTGQRKYEFPNRATVVESGVDVHIKARWSKNLFIPIRSEGMPSRYFGDPSKGYVWAKTHTYSPGESTGSTGKFTTFFATWWSREGSEILGQTMINSVNRQLKEVEGTIKGTKTLKSAMATNVKAAKEKGRKKTRKQWELKTEFEHSEEGEAIL